ncbi:N-acetylglucosamine kinase [Paenibacillus soyae]|uniref:ATPase n=1 Tax=Paenibacillus soyae TaxID=2969249 RepID=A0A9X2MRN7_9BACL|nr:BadF/BadG/BcrA/BcrD ATPase family protein [Paenibacillus soyae]MCR2805120.1 ATPase [Paenibacillus soyae]
MDSSVVIGIDGGGTHTRVMVCDLQGSKLSYVEGPASSLHKDKNAVHNVRQTILEALAAAERGLEDVRYVAAGIAGYDRPEDLEWVSELTDVPGLECPKLHVNDAVAAHAGALLAKPGIVAISGTGSIILGITESGRQIRNYDFHHYAPSAARFIAYEAVFEALAGQRDDSDTRLIAAMLRHFQADNLEELAEYARQGFHADRRERDKQFGQFAPVVTEEAERGSSIAAFVLNRAVRQLKTGIELIASAFDGDEVRVALIGSVLTSPYVSRVLTEQLADGRNKRYFVEPPRHEPVFGSVLLALKALGQPEDSYSIEA